MNHEYGYVLVRLGRLDAARRNFEDMTRQSDPLREARGLRSLAFLYMFEGAYATAIQNIRRAIVLNRSQDARVSEFRDRLILTRALLAKGRRAEAVHELGEADRMIGGSTLGPEWLSIAAKLHARLGQVRDAARLVTLTGQSVGNVTAGSSTNRVVSRDAGELALAKGELALAGGHVREALAEFEQAAARLLDGDVDESLAFASVKAGDDAAAVRHYERILDKPRLGAEKQQDWFDAHVAVAASYARMGRPDAARQRYQALLDRWPGGDEDLLILRAARKALAGQR